MAFEKELEVFGIIYENVYSMLYPVGDPLKTKAARTKNKENGGNYFSDEEVDEVLYLMVVGQFLNELVDVEV
jgi:hypothetical protein